MQIPFKNDFSSYLLKDLFIIIYLVLGTLLSKFQFYNFILY